jgi:hypothetical protein
MLINQNTLNPKAPNFKAKIRFSQGAYNKLDLRTMAKEGRYIGSPWLMEDSKILKEGFSNEASICTIGFIKPQGAQEGYLFHSFPRSNPFDKVKEIIIPVIRKFRETGNPLEGILVGANFEHKKSLEQAKNFMGLFDEFGVQYSAFLAQRPYENPFNYRLRTDYPRVDMFVSAPKDEYIISSSFEPILFDDPAKFKDRFVFVKKAPQDTIVFE